MRAIIALVKSHQIGCNQTQQKVTLPCEKLQCLDPPPTTPYMPALWFADFTRSEPKESEPGFLLDGVQRGAELGAASRAGAGAGAALQPNSYRPLCLI